MSLPSQEAPFLNSVRYPVGKFEQPATSGPSERLGAIATLAALPAQLRAAVSGLTDEQLDMPYRDGGWTLRQVVHHIADSHMNAYIRIRLALTEAYPTIKPYDQAAWAELGDASAPVAWSLAIIEGLHARWVMMLHALDQSRWHRTFLHPENGTMTVEFATLVYAWHSRHHLAHITEKRAREGW